MHLKSMMALLLLIHASCTTTSERAKVLPESVWDVTVNGISHTTLSILIDVANSPEPIDANHWFCRFQIAGTDVQWLEVQFRAANRKMRKPDYSDTLGWIVAFDRLTGNYIASSGTVLRTSHGLWYELPEDKWTEVEQFVERNREREPMLGQVRLPPDEF